MPSRYWLKRVTFVNLNWKKNAGKLLTGRPQKSCLRNHLLKAITTLLAVLTRDSLTVLEAELFKAVKRWAEAECNRKILPPTPENKRITKQAYNKIWNICASTKATGLKICRVDVLQELHIVIVVMMSP